jgi:hypothetical protein
VEIFIEAQVILIQSEIQYSHQLTCISFWILMHIFETSTYTRGETQGHVNATKYKLENELHRISLISKHLQIFK